MIGGNRGEVGEWEVVDRLETTKETMLERLEAMEEATRM